MIISSSVQAAMGAAMLTSAALALGLAGFAAWLQRASVVNPIEDGLDGAGPRKSVFELWCVEAQSRTARASVLAREAAHVGAAAAVAWDNCAMAGQARDMAWEAYAAALRSFEVALGEARERGGGDRRPTGGDDGTRQVHRAGLAAYRRGELTAEQLRRVFHFAAGSDPAPCGRAPGAGSQGLECRRARQVYEHAVAVECSLRQIAHVAGVAAGALAEEAARAAAEAHQARSIVDRCAGPARRGGTLAAAGRQKAIRGAESARQRQVPELGQFTLKVGYTSL